ncbi:MAG: hypothetical protein FD129_229 [bacterium]|nr:MAG: hypothetical protein FD129_229 [bacterium]
MTGGRSGAASIRKRGEVNWARPSASRRWIVYSCGSPASVSRVSQLGASTASRGVVLPRVWAPAGPDAMIAEPIGRLARTLSRTRVPARAARSPLPLVIVSGSRPVYSG